MNYEIRAASTMTDPDLVAIARIRGVVRGQEIRNLPGMAHQLTLIRAGRGYGATTGIVESIWTEASLHEPSVCSDERAGTLDALLTAAVEEGVREGVGT